MHDNTLMKERIQTLHIRTKPFIKSYLNIQNSANSRDFLSRSRQALMKSKINNIKMRLNEGIDLIVPQMTKYHVVTVINTLYRRCISRKMQIIWSIRGQEQHKSRQVKVKIFIGNKLLTTNTYLLQITSVGQNYFLALRSHQSTNT